MEGPSCQKSKFSLRHVKLLVQKPPVTRTTK